MKTKTKTKRHLLLLLLCGWVSTGQATDVICQDFSNSAFSQYSDKLITTSIDGWVFNQCYYYDFGAYASKKAIHVHNDENNYGYATSPQFGIACNAIIRFSFANTSSANQSTFTISIINNGVFEDGTKSISHSKNSSAATFNQVTHKIYGATETTQIKFTLTSKSKFFALDDIRVTPAEAESLSESATNTVDAAKVADVTLTRTLTGGIWNTLCLPFNIDMTTLSLALGEGQDIQLRTFSSYADGIINFTSANSISAGTPFLIKLNTTVENPTFPVVNLETTAAQTVTHGDVSMVGVYSPYELPENGVFLSTDGKLKKPSERSREMKGLRAFFTIPSNQQQNARIFIDNSTSGIAETEGTTVGSDDWHSLDGRRLSGRPTTKGLYICNGKKMILK